MTPHRLLEPFEFAPSDSAAFDELVQRLRFTEEETYVEQEVDIYALLARHTPYTSERTGSAGRSRRGAWCHECFSQLGSALPTRGNRQN